MQTHSDTDCFCFFVRSFIRIWSEFPVNFLFCVLILKAFKKKAEHQEINHFKFFNCFRMHSFAIYWVCLCWSFSLPTSLKAFHSHEIRQKKMRTNDTYVIYLKCFRWFFFVEPLFCADYNNFFFQFILFFTWFLFSLLLFFLYFPFQYALLQIVVEACQKKRHCKFLASSRTMNTDPCPETTKFIEIAYKCRPCK